MYETSGHLILKSNENGIQATCFATRPEPPERRGDGGWTGGEEVRQGTKGGNETGRRKGGSTPRYSINRGAAVRLCLTRED